MDNINSQNASLASVAFDQEQQLLLLQPESQQQPQQLQNLVLYIMAIVSTSFWIIIWVMHFCALTNARMKFNKRSYLLAANKRKTKHSPLAKKLFDKLNQQQFANAAEINQKPHYNSATGPPPSYPHKKPLFSPTDNIHASQRQQLLMAENNIQLMPDLSVVDIHETANTKVTPVAESLFKQVDSDSALWPFNSIVDEKDINNNNNNNSKNMASNKNADSVGKTKQLYNFNYNHYSYINLPLPGVSIIKPLMGVDRNLSHNLETFFHMGYPIYELLFCVQDPNDAAISVVEDLFKKYPNFDAKLFIGGSRVGVNPKINNMQPAYEASKYELILISDSGIAMRPDTLLDMVAYMNDDVALVHQMPFVNCQGRDNFQAIVERVYFGTAHARAYLTADLLNINCPTGMSALMRKCLLDDVGGIKAFSQYLAEDFFFAKSFTERGWKICISSQPALQNSANSSDTLSTLNSRIQRWIKLRFAMVPQWTLLEPFSECMLLGLLGATSINFLWALNPFAVFLTHVVLWFLLDYKLLCTIQNGPLTCSKIEFLLAWLVRECTALIVFLRALTDPKVTWRSRVFKIKWGGYTEEILS